jgi:hypothetical protein
MVAFLSTGIGLLAINSADLVTSMVTFGSLAAYCLLPTACCMLQSCGISQGSGSAVGGSRI